MAQKGPKSLRRKMINSISLAVALLTAVMGGICYSLSRGAALSQGEKTLLAGAALQAQTAAKQFEWQKNWLSDLADKIASPEFSQSLMEEPDLLNQCLPEEKKEGDPVRLRGATQTFSFDLGDGPAQEEYQIPFQEIWYQEGLQAPAWLPPEKRNGQWIVTFSMPLEMNGEKGTIAADFPIGNLFPEVSQEGYLALWDKGSRPLIHPSEEIDGSFLNQALMSQPAGKQVYSIKDYDGIKRHISFVSIPGPEWKLSYAIDRSTLLKPLMPLLWLLILCIPLSAGLAALLAAWHLKPFEKAIDAITKAIQKMGKGDYHMEIPYKREDEVGALCREVETACASTHLGLEELSHTLGRMAQGDFTVKTDAFQTGDFAEIGEAIDRIAQALHQVFKQINLTAKWALGGSHQVSGVSGRMNAGVESQTTSAEELEKAVAWMYHESSKNAVDAIHAKENAMSTSSDLRECFRQVSAAAGSIEETIRNLQALAEDLDRIHKIAAQGRMLSFSASAEAERVCDDVAAFAMAADELRELFLKVEQNTQESQKHLNIACQATVMTENCVGKAEETLHEVVKKNGQAREILNRIASVSQLQAQTAEKMNKAVSIISVVIQSNAQLAEQVDFSKDSMAEQAKKLASMASSFYTRGESAKEEKSAPIIFDEDSGGFSVTGEK